ncbi:hypothetical protein CC85DRAFT_285350, partial [Cutaneotrichosporon oleaginosum]
MPGTPQNCTSPVPFVAVTCCAVVGGQWTDPLCETRDRRMFIACSDGMAAANRTLVNAHGGCTGGSGAGKKSGAARARVGVLALVWCAAAAVCTM